METNDIPAAAKLSRVDHERTEVWLDYVKWREVLITNIRNQKTFPLLEEEDLEREQLAVNRQVALAIVSDLEYNFRKSGNDIHYLTGKSNVYWNFQVLGTTVKHDGGKHRVEQKTSNYFLASTLNWLAENGVSLDLKRLGFYLMSARWRVIAEPAEIRVPKEEAGKRVSMREQFRLQCGREGIEAGVNYPAPWHVANWCGIHEEPAEDRRIEDWRDYKDTTQHPGRIRRLDIACFGPDGNSPRVVGESKFMRRPSILTGLGRRSSVKRDDAVGSELEEMLEKAMRKVHPVLDAEIQRRKRAERRADRASEKVAAMQETMDRRRHEQTEVTELRKENKDLRRELERLQRKLDQIHSLTRPS